MTNQDETDALVRQLREDLASENLPPTLAKLYSQHTRLSAQQLGLSNWRPDEGLLRLRDAMRLLDAGFVERETGEEKWLDSVRRAGEILEWLSHPDLVSEPLPTRFLAAAAYQIAGYPARSSGLLNEAVVLDESEILKALLRADFVGLLQLLMQYWQSADTTPGTPEFSWSQYELLQSQLQRWVTSKVVSALGILCAYIRWGDDSRLETSNTILLETAGLMLHGDNPYSWLLARLCAEVVRQYGQSVIRRYLGNIFQNIDQEGQAILERYIRQAYKIGRSLAWPSQMRGIERLSKQESFVLCTPTGSGKTMIAELAILESLFPRVQSTETLDFKPLGLSASLAIYLVPSRALASEVEAKLSRVLRRSEVPIINVTGLYGGTDWGPTDAWLTANERTVLICTYEKGEALLRFLGPLFLRRVSLLIIDEAHSVQFDGKAESLISGESRSLRLESLSMRLLSSMKAGRIIALSAVAAGIDKLLAQWVSGDENAVPEKTFYRSTRQLIGRLMCIPGGRFEIVYDLLDGSELSFKGTVQDQGDSPFIPNPFPHHPPVGDKWSGPETRLRPYLFWAAMQLAQPDVNQKQHTVLISIPQQISGYIDSFLTLFEMDWANTQFPTFFLRPTDPEKAEIWRQCLRSCEDYYTRTSREYRLLEKGIVVHYGRMPGLLSRLLVKVVQEQIVHIVLATSTLSEGVNLPFETILIPTLRRGTGKLSLSEFANLVGRAGRPGFGTEGKTLVLFASTPNSKEPKDIWSFNNNETVYKNLVSHLQRKAEYGSANGESPIARLLLELEIAWRKMTRLDSHEEFLGWLEKTIIDDLPESVDSQVQVVVNSLDTLDGILLAAIVEIEQLADADLTADEVEDQLKRVWQRSFAYVATSHESWLTILFSKRGRTLKEKVIPDKTQRKRLYCTSLSPRQGFQLLNLYPSLRQLLLKGVDYVGWERDERIKYILDFVGAMTHIPRFASKGNLNSKVTRGDVLSWWLDPKGASKRPNDKQIATWHEFVSDNFHYRFNWALGSFIAVVINDVHNGELLETKIEDWPKTGLPWIVFWLKELIVWGTLEPVAAFLLARQLEMTRADAEHAAQEYYSSQPLENNADDLLNAVRIRDWALDRHKQISSPSTRPPETIKVSLLRDFVSHADKKWRVLPVENEHEIRWFDIAGYLLAVSDRPAAWLSSFLHDYDFILNPDSKIVTASAYL